MISERSDFGKKLGSGIPTPDTQLAGRAQLGVESCVVWDSRMAMNGSLSSEDIEIHPMLGLAFAQDILNLVF